MNDGDRKLLESYLGARHPAVLIPTYEEQEVLRLLRRVAVDRGSPLRGWSYSTGVHDVLIGEREEGAKDTERPDAGLYYLLSKPRACLTVLIDVLGHAREPRVLRLLRDLVESLQSRNGHLILVDHIDEPPDVLAHVTTVLRPSLPSDDELKELIRSTIRMESSKGANRVTAKLSKGTLGLMVRNLAGLTRGQAERIILDAVAVDRKLVDEDLNTIMARKRQMLERGGLLEYVESPVTLDEVAGFRGFKRWLRQRERSFAGDAARYGLRPPRGVLMLGVPGAGKSLAAKAVATAWKRPLLRLDPSVLYDRYIGESERRLRQALQQAEAMSPIVLWVDEIEKGFASAASQSTDGGLSQRMFGTMLTWMQEHRAPVFLFATANNIKALPPELLRKGRFDETFFVDLPAPKVRRAIFEIHLRKRGQDPAAFDLDDAVAASEGRTGAEIEQAVVAGLHAAMDEDRELTAADLIAALDASPPLSVTMAEHIDGIRAWASGRCRSAD